MPRCCFVNRSLAIALVVTLTPRTGLAQPVRACPGVIFSVDGSACLRDMAPDLNRAIAEAGLPLAVERFGWSHGPGRIFADLHGRGRHRDKGKELAGAILAQRQTYPCGKIYLVCHSSGAAVGLAAVESLPPGTVDRIILLAPALSPRYDLCPSLRCACEGIDVFTSRRDVISHALALIGTTDGTHRISAGCLGFTPDPSSGGDPALYANLRQHPWESGMGAAGHLGGHFGCTRVGFFRAYLVPLLAVSCGP